MSMVSANAHRLRKRTPQKERKKESLLFTGKSESPVLSSTREERQFFFHCWRPRVFREGGNAEMKRLLGKWNRKRCWYNWQVRRGRDLNKDASLTYVNLFGKLSVQIFNQWIPIKSYLKKNVTDSYIKRHNEWINGPGFSKVGPDNDDIRFVHPLSLSECMCLSVFYDRNQGKAVNYKFPSLLLLLLPLLLLLLPFLLWSCNFLNWGQETLCRSVGLRRREDCGKAGWRGGQRGGWRVWRALYSC